MSAGEITDIEGSIRELRLFAEAGGSALVEGTAADYGRDPQKLVYASRQSGVHLIATAGFYLFDHNPDFIDDISTEELAELFIREIEEGMDGTEIDRVGEVLPALHLPVHASVVPLHADLLAICPRSTA